VVVPPVSADRSAYFTGPPDATTGRGGATNLRGRVGEIVVVTGHSGAGRSTAADVFEDLGWFVIDNLPLALMPKVSELTAAGTESRYERVVLVVGASPDVVDITPAIERLREQGAGLRILFLEASADTLVRRYKESRRRHPFSNSGSLADAVLHEQQALEELRGLADLVIDTTNLNVHQLKDRVLRSFSLDDPTQRMRTSVVSFGFKYGLPLDVDVVLDCRFLPNPFWVPELKPQSGLDDAVRDYVLGQDAAREFLQRLRPLLETLVPAYLNEGKAYLSLAFGCTGGRHRSVAIAEAVVPMLAELGVGAEVSHRDIDR
jgi:RNase adapter protein RapZ